MPAIQYGRRWWRLSRLSRSAERATILARSFTHRLLMSIRLEPTKYIIQRVSWLLISYCSALQRLLHINPRRSKAKVGRGRDTPRDGRRLPRTLGGYSCTPVPSVSDSIAGRGIHRCSCVQHTGPRAGLSSRGRKRRVGETHT